jgi:hypothetical protein
MKWIIVGVLSWLVCSRIVYRVLLLDYYRTFKRVTRGDIAFFCYIAAHGPIALPLAFLVHAGNQLDRFWSKQVWPKTYQSAMHE